MGYKEVQDLNPDVVISLGGINKKTGKKNPTSIEGYYLGNKKVADNKKKSGHSFIYTFQTPEGNIGVWGKTDLDRKMQTLTPGFMTRVSVNGMRETPNGEMYVFKVEFDPENTVEVAVPTATFSTLTEDDTEGYEGEEDDGANSFDYSPAAALNKKAAVQELLSRKAKKA